MYEDHHGAGQAAEPSVDALAEEGDLVWLSPTIKQRAAI